MITPRQMPQDLEAEVSMLGSIFLNPTEIMDACSASLTPQHFQTRSHQIIYSAFCEMISSGKPIDPMTLTSHLKDSGKIDEVGGAHYISKIMVEAPTSAHTDFYIKSLTEKFQLRKLIDIGSRVQSLSYEGADPLELISTAELDLFNLTNGSVTDVNEVKQAGDELDSKINRMLNGEKVVGFPSGLSTFDNLTSGYRKKLNYIFAGPPGGGKTSWVEQSCMNNVENGVPALFISLDMPVDRLLERMALRKVGLSLWRFLNNRLTKMELLMLQDAKNKILKMPLYIIRPMDATGPELRSTIRRFKRKHGIEIVAVDYLQRLQSKVHRETRLAIAEASSSLANAFQESDVAGIVISQTNKEASKDPRPKMSHLAESAQIERDADFIGFLWCEVEKHTLEKGEPQPTLLSMEKNRDGPSGNDEKFYFYGDKLTFKDRS